MPKYHWNPTRQQYENASTGQAVAHTQIREWVDATVAGSKSRVRDISQRFADGKIDLPAWQTQIQAELKGAHVAMSEIASGGRAQWTATQAGRVGVRLREQYKYLNEFGLAIDRGDIDKGDGLMARSEMYAEAERATYEGIRRGQMLDAGFAMERNVLGNTDNNCEGCLAADAEDWVPIGTLDPPGERDCLSNCLCSLEYSMVSLEDGGE